MTCSSIVLGFLNPSPQLWHTNVTDFCMQLRINIEIQTIFNSQCAFHFPGIIREVELLSNDWYSGCNLMRDNPLTRSEIPLPQHVWQCLLSVALYAQPTSHAAFDFDQRQCLQLAKMLPMDSITWRRKYCKPILTITSAIYEIIKKLILREFINNSSIFN